MHILSALLGSNWFCKILLPYLARCACAATFVFGTFVKTLNISLEFKNFLVIIVANNLQHNVFFSLFFFFLFYFFLPTFQTVSFCQQAHTNAKQRSIASVRSAKNCQSTVPSSCLSCCWWSWWCQLLLLLLQQLAVGKQLRRHTHIYIYIYVYVCIYVFVACWSLLRLYFVGEHGSSARFIHNQVRD